MADLTPPTSPQPQTLGQHLDAVLSGAGHDVSIATTDAKTWVDKAWTWVDKAWTWIKSEWHNLVTAASTLYLALKAASKL